MTIYPTVLYIKQHSITGLKYFGKTTRDPYKYNGSGKHWVRHIKKHGRKYIITTDVFGPFTDKDAIIEFALAFSRDNNIVESKDWANQRPENGLDGWTKGVKHHNPSPLKGKPSKKKGKPSGKQLNPSNKPSPLKGKPSKKKGIPTGKPAWNKGISTGPSEKKGKPTGKPAWNKGILTGQQPEVECPHCGLVGGNSAMKRHHFDNCKMNNI
jgi:hypothetical protein